LQESSLELLIHFFPYQIPNVIHLKLAPFLLNSLLEFCKLKNISAGTILFF
jgi:hypothetical protein